MRNSSTKATILIDGAKLLLQVAAYCFYIHFIGLLFYYMVTGKRRVEDLNAAVYFRKHINRSKQGNLK